MKTAILYFSRTGISKRVAEKIAQKIDAPVACITDGESWKGPAGFAKGAMYAAKWQTTQPMVSPEINYNDFDEIVIVSPVWAGNPAPAAYSLIMQEMTGQLEKVHLVLTCGGMNLPVPHKIESKLGKLKATYVIAKFKDNEDDAVERIVLDLL